MIAKPHKAYFKSGAKVVLVVLVMLVTGVEAGHAYFEDLGMGSRPIGMGEAFVAVADDSNAVLWNVAGLAGLKTREINLMYSDLYSQLNGKLYTGDNDHLGFHNIGMVMPFDPVIGSFGFTWTYFDSVFYKENTFILSYARSIGDTVFEWAGVKDKLKDIGLDAGINLKLLNWMLTEDRYTALNPALQSNKSRTGFTADFGLLATFPYGIKAGLSVANLIPANMGVVEYETAPINFRLGASYTYEFDKKGSLVNSLLGTLELTQRNNISDLRVGTEAWFFEHQAALRMGSTADQFAAGISYLLPIARTPIKLRFDYAFTYSYTIQDTIGSHRVAMVVFWNPEPREAYFKPLQ